MELEAFREGLAGAVRSAGVTDLPGLIGVLAEMEALAQLALNGARVEQRPKVEHGPNANISASQAARRLGMSRDWLYRNAGRLPFAVRIGRRVLFDAQGLERWNRSRASQ